MNGVLSGTGTQSSMLPAALPTSPPCKLPGCPIVGTRRGDVALSFPHAERAGPPQDPVATGSFFALLSRVWQGGTRLLLPRVKGAKLAWAAASNGTSPPKPEGECWLSQPRS